MLARNTHRAKLAQNLENCAADSGSILVQLSLATISRRPSRRSETLYRAFWRRKFFKFLTFPFISGKILEKSEEGPLGDCTGVQVT